MTSQPAVPGSSAPAAATPRSGRAPSLSRVFTVAFLVIAFAGLLNRVVVWQSARRTQTQMVELTRRLEQLARLRPSADLRARIDDMLERTTEAGDDAVQSAIQT